VTILIFFCTLLSGLDINCGDLTPAGGAHARAKNGTEEVGTTFVLQVLKRN